ncbi:MAG TPA: SIMPL domain-containing protein [Pseudolabrys sp.]|nr:SIMPL domain-containing protein [Pseudolabrys sp.]
MPVSRLLFCIFAAAVVVAPVSAQPTERVEKLITVTGEGTAAAVPDSAVIRLGVSSQGKTARAASDANAKEMTGVLAAIKETGVADRDIQTTSLSLQPQYEQNKPGAARLIGFQANNQVTVKIRDIANLPSVLDRAIAAGANEMSGIEFVVSEQAKLLDKARTDAIAEARRKAELYATAAGMKVGRVMAISEEGAAPQPRPYQALRAGAAAPIAPGEQMLRAVVTISFELTS